MRSSLAVALGLLIACGPSRSAEPSPSASPQASSSAAASPTPRDDLVAPLPGVPTIGLYLPYLAKTRGGATGWETPFIIQNADSVPTDLELNFFAIPDGKQVARRIVRALKPGTSYADQPNKDPDLAGDGEYSAVVRSFGGKVVAVVNLQRGVGARFEADAYVSQIGGAQSVFLPSVARQVDGFVSRVVVQNVDDRSTAATAAFVSLKDGTTTSVTRSIEPGRSSIIDVGAEPGLSDGTAYAVRINASARLNAIVNTHRDAPSDAAPVVYSYGALVDGANTLFGPYAAKNVPGIGAGNSVIAVQNMASVEARPSLAFTPLNGGAVTTFDGPTLGPGASWLFELRYRGGDAGKAECGRSASTGCLADGEYSWTVGVPGAQLAALATAIGKTTAVAYTALSRPGDVFLPNVTRTLGGRDGWTTTIVVQSVSASRLTLTWYRFSDGQVATTQSVAITPGSAIRIDPRDVAGLRDDTQYAVAIGGNGGRLTALVVELNFQGGDGAAIYTGFFR